MFIYARSEHCDFIGGPTYLLSLMTIKEKSSLTGPGIFMVVFSHEKEEDSAKKISRFIRDLTAEDTINSQISQNRAHLCAFKIALNNCPISNNA